MPQVADVIFALKRKINKSEVGKKIVHGVFWSFLGTVVFRGLIFLSSIVIARLLKKEGFGELGMIRSTIDMFIVFSIFGLGITTTKFVAEYRDTDKEKAGRVARMALHMSVIMGLLISVSLFFSSGPLAKHSLDNADLGTGLRYGSWAILFYAINGVQTGILAGLEAFKKIAKVNLVAGVVNLPIAIGLTWFLGVNGAIIGLTINALLIAVLGGIEVRRETKKFGINVNEKDYLKEMKVLYTFSLPAVLSGLLVLPVNWYCNVLLAKEPSGYAYLGVYNAALSISLIISVINTTLGQALLPQVIRNFKQKNAKLEAINNFVPWGIGIFLSMPFILVPEIAGVAFGKDFTSGNLNGTVVIVMIGTIVIAHRQGIARNFAAGNFMWWSMLSNGIWGLLAIFYMIGLKQGGSEGRAGAYAFAYFISTVVFVPFYIKKQLADAYFLISPESLAIWGIIFVSFIVMLMFHLSIYVRILLLLVACAIILWIFYRVYKHVRSVS
ncbi:oligosaccharide flippase family protein [Chitinophaga sp. 22321]|uniref:Oligosaccharide flippase family protein n=1 Tax=Chitinophaga hostae TaxID=2831022 RepID=A0ABS5J339_9BACT|nr:oligosaccharide flippase family protein [Chitinophaga hostae]MBS0028842.1 oligosaccharide flippase family protein [Chitinophaga hostae]